MQAGFVSVIHREHFMPEHTRRSRSLLNNSDRTVQSKKRRVFEQTASFLSAANGTDCHICHSLYCFLFLKGEHLILSHHCGWNKSTTWAGLFFFLKKKPMNWTNQMNTLVFTLEWSFPDVQSNALYISGPKVLKFFILPLYSWRSVIVAVFLAFIAYNTKKSCTIL